MFPRANILVVEPLRGQGGNVTSCLKKALEPCSLAACALDDALYLANRYDFDLVVFGPGVDMATTGILATVIKAIKPQTLVVALAGDIDGGDGAAWPASLDARLSLPGECHRLAGMVRGSARLAAIWAA